MVDLTITAANVVAGSNADIEHGKAGMAITAGQVLYKEVATKTFKLADSNSATAEAKDPYGIALHAAAANQPLAVHKKGDITIGATLTPGTAYYLSETPGGIQPAADLGSGEKVSQIGLAKSASVLTVNIQKPGVTL